MEFEKLCEHSTINEWIDNGTAMKTCTEKVAEELKKTTDLEKERILYTKILCYRTYERSREQISESNIINTYFYTHFLIFRH